MNSKPDLNTSSRLAYAIAGALYLPIAFLLFHWINYMIGIFMGYPVYFYWNGIMIPCVNAKHFIEAHPGTHLEHFFYVYWALLVAWPVAGMLIYVRARRLENSVGIALQWLGVLMITAPLYHVIINLAQDFVFLISRGRYHFGIRTLLSYIFFAGFITAAIWIYRKSFRREGKKKLWLISFPVFVLCWWLWFFVIGKHLLP